MIRADIDFAGAGHRVFLHEISHLFCCENEIEGGGFLTATAWVGRAEGWHDERGYAVWREAVADISG